MDNCNNFQILIDAGNVNWDENSERLEYFIKQKLAYVKMVVRRRGHLFLNELFDIFDAPRRAYGQVYVVDNPDDLKFTISKIEDTACANFVIEVDGFKLFTEVAYLFK